MELILENIRCFAQRQTVPVKPLTLLVGENSAGKSTFLACLSAASDPFGFPLRPRFNERPYNLGNYDTIATNRGGRASLAKSFSLGYTQIIAPDNHQAQIVATYKDYDGSLKIAEVEINYGIFYAHFELQNPGELNVDVTRDEERTPETFRVTTNSYSGDITRHNLRELLAFATSPPRPPQLPVGEAMYFSLLDSQDEWLSLEAAIKLPPTLSVAPIRSEPKRTYTEIQEEFSPTGEHVPYVLEDVLQDPANRKLLEDFGKESGLFSKVAVKLWGKKRSDPLSVMVTNEGRPQASAANLTDVGYGVSQALPLVVQSVLAAPESRLLLQQPEVHLHPRAQAALGTLFVDLVASTKKQFVVETHSDYILDRVRQEVARGKITASDVQILYFEREKQGTHVYPIGLDDKGGISNEPPSYRSFFLQEEYNLLTRAHKNGVLK